MTTTKRNVYQGYIRRDNRYESCEIKAANKEEALAKLNDELDKEGDDCTEDYRPLNWTTASVGLGRIEDDDSYAYFNKRNSVWILKRKRFIYNAITYTAYPKKVS